MSTWPVLGSGGSDAVGYGGFVGYNTQWQDLVLGLEGNYTHTAFATTASFSPISRQAGRIVTAGGTQYSVNLTGTGQLTITDYASLRARGGWVLGNFLPYGFAGLAIGRGNYSVTTQVYGQAEFSHACLFSVRRHRSRPASTTTTATVLRKMARCCMASPSVAGSTGRSRKIFSCAANLNTSSLRR